VKKKIKIAGKVPFSSKTCFYAILMTSTGDKKFRKGDFIFKFLEYVKNN
jgi:hypothetical protein